VGELAFIIVAAIVIVTAFWVVTARNLVHSAVALMGTLFGVAGLYVFLYADFMAAVQVVIYVGGIMVLIIFGVMLTQRISAEIVVQTSMPNRIVAALAVLVLFIGLVAMILNTPWYTAESAVIESTVAVIGTSLLTKYLLHFEVASVLLLMALLGAAYLSRRENA
jgi:NADH-quinone oxidoreductase subunit J